MIEKIKLSLWDIVTFFMTGVLLVAIVVSFFLLKEVIYLEELIDLLKDLPAVILIFVIPIFLTLFGLLIEPFASYFDRSFSRYTLPKFCRVNSKLESGSDFHKVEKYIKEKCLGDLSNQIKNPFILCKEYVETKQLSTTFMVFLSRFGFYRNSSFLLFISIPFYLFLCIEYEKYNVVFDAFMIIFLYSASALFKRRGGEFFSLQAKSVYSAFLIDNLNWPAKEQSPETLNLNIGDKSDVQ